MIAITTTWVKPPHQIGGLDHLGVQAPCIQIYGDLLPGITNVTDRARYYSFYPWLFAQFEKEGWRDKQKVTQMLRRADCLLTLVGLRHAQLDPEHSELHRAAMVGNDVLSRAIMGVEAGGMIRLSDYAQLDESPDRYFKNPNGALGQYYFGTLYGLSLMDGDSADVARVVEQTGVKLAELVSLSVPGELFIKCLVSDEISSQDLDDLSGFCGCQLKTATAEVDALVGIMLSGWPALYADGAPSDDELRASKVRAHSLAYMCQLADITAENEMPFDVLLFRAMTYTRSGPLMMPVDLPEQLLSAELSWQVYQRNELLSIALQGLFYAQLRACELASVAFDSTASLSEWFWLESIGADALGEDKTVSCQNFIVSIANNLPDFSNWQDEQHEIQCMERIRRMTGKKGTSISDVTLIFEDALTVLAAIIVRPENSMGYGEYTFPDNYLDYYPVNLGSVMEGWKAKIADLMASKGMAKFIQTNCLDAHLRVAMRKLHQQGNNTFRFELSELGIVVKDIPSAANTSPRFRQAVRILEDLGLLESENGLIKTTPSGRRFVEAAL